MHSQGPQQRGRVFWTSDVVIGPPSGAASEGSSKTYRMERRSAICRVMSAVRVGAAALGGGGGGGHKVRRSEIYRSGSPSVELTNCTASRMARSGAFVLQGALVV